MGGFALAVTIEALFQGNTSLWDGVPEIIGLVLFFVLMCCVGLLEGMQIAFFTVAKIPKSERGSHTIALKTCECLFKNGGKNLPGFMCGRQMTVTLCFFIIARVTTINTTIGGADNDTPTGNIFGVSDGMQKFFNFGFCGALITTILGSISWQLVAAAFPIGFLNNPIVYLTLMIALAIEATGLMSAAWFLAYIQKRICKFQLDEVYVGTAEERAAKGHADKTDGQLHLGTNVLPSAAHQVGGHNISREYMDLVQETYANQREKVMSNISELREHIKAATTDEERQVFEDAMKLEVEALKSVNRRQTQSLREMTLALEEDVEGGQLMSVLLMRTKWPRCVRFNKYSAYPNFRRNSVHG